MLDSEKGKTFLTIGIKALVKRIQTKVIKKTAISPLWETLLPRIGLLSYGALEAALPLKLGPVAGPLSEVPLLIWPAPYFSNNLGLLLRNKPFWARLRLLAVDEVAPTQTLQLNYTWSFGGLHSTEVAFVLLTKQSRVRFPVFLKVF